MSTVLELRGVSKSFGPTQVLKGIDLAIEKGQTYALMGANGAGKSTLIKVLAGAHRADAGEIWLNGRPVQITDPTTAQRLGIATVHQNPNDGVVLDMTVAENLALDTFAGSQSRGWRYSRRATEAYARQVAQTLGLEMTPAMLRRPVRDLGVSERQLLVLARAMSRRPEILILDEPTSALSAEEADRLFSLVEDLRTSGHTVLFVSHKLAEIDQVSRHLGVLRDGRMRGEFDRTQAEGFDWPAVLRALFDRSPSELRHDELTGDKVAMSLRGVRIFADAAPIDLDVREGEVTALLGLLGSGKSELLESIFGSGTRLGGRVEVDGAPLEADHPSQAIERGVYLVPESRHEQAIVPGWSLDSLMTLPFVRRFSTSTFMSRRREKQAAREMIERLGVVTSGPGAAIETLSGGNQQKVVIGRWLLGQPRCLLLDEPFRGVDINARHDIGSTVRELTSSAAVVVATSDIDEAFEVADRIVVLSQGAVVADLRLGEATREGVLDAMSHRASALLADEPPSGGAETSTSHLKETTP